MSQIAKSISHPTSWIFFAPFWRFHKSVHQIYFELFSARFKVHYGKSSGKWPFWQRAGELVLYLLQKTILYLLQNTIMYLLQYTIQNLLKNTDCFPSFVAIILRILSANFVFYVENMSTSVLSFCRFVDVHSANDDGRNMLKR